jgi:transposase
VGSPPGAEPMSWCSSREVRVEQQQPGRGQVWVGIDIGKHVHHAAAVDGDGRLVWSRRVANDQTAIVELIGQAASTTAGVCWAVDSTGGSAALLLALLVAADQRVVYVPGRMVNRMAGAFAGEAKTDAKDALVIAQTARLRQDLGAARPRPDLVAELAVLVGHRTDLLADWVRTVSRLRGLLTASFPGLERCFDFTSRSTLVLVARYQTPEALRAVGRRRLVSWLRRQVPAQLSDARVEQMADAALAAAAAQRIRLPAQEVTAQLIAQLARDLLALDRRIKDLDKTIGQRLDRHPQAKIITSLPGMGPLLAAELLVAIGDQSSFPDADHLAAYGGWPRFRATRAGAPTTSIRPGATTEAFGGCSTCRRCRACPAPGPTGTTTGVNAPKDASTSRP